MDLIIKDDSYARRREVFKNIWVSALRPSENQGNRIKSKIIRTARLSTELQRYNFMKKKHQRRIKHLKTTCDKILGNETETMFFEQLTASHPLRKIKRRKKKKHNIKKKKDDELRQIDSLIIAPIRSLHGQNFAKPPLQVMSVKAGDNHEEPEVGTANDAPAEATTKRRRKVKRKRGKRKNHRSI